MRETCLREATVVLVRDVDRLPRGITRREESARRPFRNVFVTFEDSISAIGNVSTTSEISAMPEFSY
jgi:hypothetical protein